MLPSVSSVHRAPHRALAGPILGLVLGLLLATLGPLAPARADVSRQSARQASGVSILCTGYVGCRDRGYSNSGYQAANDQMYWLMYSGHNCTNYAAYRMVQSGLPNSRPWSGGGNAEYWGIYMKSITDDVPAVGAVAWWRENASPAGSAGHVAYVEQVISSNEIIVSQDSWGGDFSWARITRGGGSWPSGFVHFNDVKLENVAKPDVTGVTKVGGALSASPGSWTPQGSNTTYTYQWKAGADPIEGATGPSLTLAQEQQGKRISVKVTAARPGYPTSSVVSDKTSYVEPGVISSLTAPTVSGEATVDHELVASGGTWKPAPAELTYQWYADGQLLEGVTQSTYTPGPAQVGLPISVTVTATKPGYDPVSATSLATAAVQKATFTVRDPATLGGTPRLGDVLTLDPGTWSPGVADTTVVWLRDGVPIEGALGTSYTLTTDDLGHHVSASLTLTRAGYEDLVQTVRPSGLVKTVPTMVLRSSRPGTGRLAVHVALGAAGVPVVAGVVRIVARGHLLAELTLDRYGRAARVLRGLPAGLTNVRFSYLGSDTVVGTTLRKTVTIK
ncbi:hypothetical protein GCM10027600_18660 [Nocardioides ginsengisegetis]